MVATVDASNHPSLVPGTRPGVPRPPRVEQRHPGSGAKQVQRGPPAEGPCTDDNNVQRPGDGRIDRYVVVESDAC